VESAEPVVKANLICESGVGLGRVREESWGVQMGKRRQQKLF